MNKAQHFAAALILSFALFLLPAISVQAPNAASFTASAWQVLLPFVLAFLLAAAVLALVSLLCSWSPRLLVAYLVATILALLCSQVFGQTESVVLDGARHQLTVPWLRAALELAVLAAVTAAGLFLWRRIAASAGTAVLVIGGWALASGVVSGAGYLQANDEAGRDALPLTSLSRDFNVLHVMFDSLRSDAFSEILAAHPDLARKLDGFTVYPEHAGYSNWTTISLGAILADRLYFEEPLPDEPANDLFGRWIAEDSLPARLHRDGFAVGVVPPGRIFCEGAAYACAPLDVAAAAAGVGIAEEDDPEAVRDAERVLLANLALLRLAPSVLKPSVYRDGAFLLAPDGAGPDGELTPIQRDVVLSRDFARHLAADFTVGTDRPVYRFLHFYPPHRPFMLDADCRLQPPGPEDWPTYLAQATCAVRLFAGFLDRLKEIGVYDRTVIVLQADTGLNVLRDGDKGPPVTSTEAYGQGELIGYARPALAIKPLGGHGDLAVSDRPTHHRDTFALLEEASRGGSGPPRLELTQEAAEEGPRPFVVSGPVRPHTRRLVPFERFAVDGPISDWRSWRFEGTFEAPGKPLAAQAPIDAVRLAVEPDGPAVPGQTIHLTAEVTGGSGRPVLMFFRRKAGGGFAVVSPRGFERQVDWVVEDGNRDPCRLELLVSARNELDPEDSTKLGEHSVALAGPGC